MKLIIFLLKKIDHITAEPYWRDAYVQLDAQHRLADQGISLAFYLKNAELNDHWIKMYFDNIGLFNGRMALRFFLDNNPAELFDALRSHSCRAPSATRPTRKLKRLPDDTPFISSYSQVRMAGGRFIEPIKQVHAISKFRTCGGRTCKH